MIRRDWLSLALRHKHTPIDQFVKANFCSDLEDIQVKIIYNDILNCLNQCLLNKQIDPHNGFNIVKFELCGSFADGTRIKDDEIEFDILAVSVPGSCSYIPSNTCPGYVHQILPSTPNGCTSDPHEISDYFINLIMKHLPNYFTLKWKWNKIQLLYTGARPTTVVVDIHPVIPSNFPHTPELLYVIPVSCKQPGHKCWRISYCQTEIKLLRNAKPHHILSFRILKVLLWGLLIPEFGYNEKYVLKTAVCLHEIACTHNINIYSCTLSILDIMHEGYISGFLPSIAGGINVLKITESTRHRYECASIIFALRDLLKQHFGNTADLFLNRSKLAYHVLKNSADKCLPEKNCLTSTPGLSFSLPLLVAMLVTTCPPTVTPSAQEVLILDELCGSITHRLSAMNSPMHMTVDVASPSQMPTYTTSTCQIQVNQVTQPQVLVNTFASTPQMLLNPVT